MDANPNFLTPGYLLVHRYSIQATIGQGGFGITYLAYDQKLGQEVCIKELFVSGNCTRGINFTVQSQSIGGFTFDEFVQRFVQEAHQLARFQHPNIVGAIDIFQENGTAYTVMEYVKGETLKSKILREGALGEKEAMSLISQLLEAVEEVHSKEMLHRDIKPDNVLITPEGRVVLIDFGSAREFVDGKTTTQTAMLTPGYAPIEQYSTRAQRGPYTDIYALGATMYFLLTGEKPIPVTDRNLEELVAPHLLNQKISSQVSSAVMLAMEFKPENRFQSVVDMREAIKSLQKKFNEIKKEKLQKKPNPDEEKVVVKNKPRGRFVYIMIFLLVFLSALVVYFAFYISPFPNYIFSQNPNDKSEEVQLLTDTTNIDGISYTYIKEGFQKPANGDFLLYNLEILTQTDSVIYSTLKQPFPGYLLANDTIKAQNGMDEIFLSMRKGDSITFEAAAKIIFSGNQPAPIKENELVKVRLGAYEVKTEAEMQAYYEEAMQKEQEKSAERAKELLMKESKIIEKYILDKGLNAKKTESGLYYVIEKEGLGKTTTKGTTMYVNYSGYLLNGALFDTSLSNIAKANNIFSEERPYEPLPVNIGMGQVIPGWDEGLMLLKKGSKARLIIPSPLGYGESGAGALIPANSILVFDVEIVDVN
jgi:serine/threonine protein kinase/FKBP-type peptidyl-prolyl cis-trans isomerase